MQKFSGYCFYIFTDIYQDSQIHISVPLMQAYLMQNRCCAIGCFLNNSSEAHVH